MPNNPRLITLLGLPSPLVLLLCESKLQKLMVLRAKFQNDLDNVKEKLSEQKYDERVTLKVMHTNRLIDRLNLTPQPQVVVLLSQEADLLASLERVNDLIVQCSIFTEGLVYVTESLSEGPVSGEMKVAENLTDIVGDEVKMEDAGKSFVPDVGIQNLLSLDDFFSRPIHIDSFTVAVGSPIRVFYRIWDLYTKAPSVRSKLRNYSFFKADLVVRVALSGSPFHYGKMLISYQPYGDYNEPLLHLNNMFGLGGYTAVDPLLLTYLSQSRGAVTMDYNDNKPTDIFCPFISPKCAHRLYASSASVLAGASSYPDIYPAGQLWIRSINDVSAVGTSPSPISVHVYAWLENVELGPPTATQIAIITEGRDERQTGPVEKAATFMASVSNALSTVPGIGPLAKASSMVFGGLGGVAAWFGWSKPGVIDDPHFVKNRPYATTSQVIGRDTIDKISLDPMQEVSVDPRICASNEDEMSLAFLNQLSTYLTTFTWAHNSAPLTVLWNSAVHPQLASYASHMGKPTLIQPTPMCFAAQCFKYWRGTIKFRLEIACSQFHRGKIAVMFEPNFNQYSLIDASFALNKNYLKIIDIQETQDIEFCVHYAQPYMWLKTVGCTDVLDMYGTGFDPSSRNQQINGYISIFPFTELQSPDDSDIYINMYVSSENMQYNVMDDTGLPAEKHFWTEGRHEGIENPKGHTCVDLNESSDTGYGIAEYCFGEMPVSLRQLLKRYTTVFIDSDTLDGTQTGYYGVYCPTILPANPSYGNAYSGQHTTFLEYLPYAYLGVKGGMRYRARLNTYATGGVPCSDNNQAATVVRLKEPTQFNAYSTWDGFGTYTSEHAWLTGLGSNLSLTHTNSGVEFEVPYYSSNLFQFSFDSVFKSDVTDDSFANDWVCRYEWLRETNDTGTPLIVFDAASAEDFTFLRFMGAPFYNVPTG